MKKSIKTRVLQLLFSFVASILLILGIGALYGMERSEEFASHYVADVSNAAIDNSAGVITSMRKNELLMTVEKNAVEIADFTSEVRYDVRMLQTEMERIWANPSDYRGAPIPPATEDQVWDERIPVEELDQTVHAFLTYAPGVNRAALQDEVAVTSNIRDFMMAFVEQAQHKKAHQTAVLGTISGFLIKGDIVAPKLDLEFRDSIWYRSAMEKGELTFSPIYRVQGSKTLVAVACTAPYRRNGEILGVIGFGVGLDDLDKLMKNSLDLITEANPDGLNFLLDEQGRVIFCKRKEGAEDKFLGELFANTKQVETFPLMDRPEVLSALKDMKDGKKAIVDFNLEDKKYTLAYAPIKDMNWMVGAIIPQPNVEMYVQENRSQVHKLTDSRIQDLHTKLGQDSMLFVLLVLILAALSAYSGLKLSNRLVKPLLELRNGLKEIAKGNLDYKIELDTKDEIEEVANTINDMTVELKNYVENIARITAEKQSIATEISVAHDIQLGALPHDFMTERKEFQIYATMDPAKGIGGDLYDFYMLDENHLAITIGDVSGKGIPAALFMMRAKTAIKNQILTASKPIDYASVMTLANRELCKDNETMMFVTVFFAELNLTTGEIIYVNAGHFPPCLYESGKFSFLSAKKKHMMLGADEDATYIAHSLTLKPNDMLFLYTDGVTEAMNNNKELYSEERLEKTLNRIGGDVSIPDILAEVLKDIGDHADGAEQSDDIAMLGLRFMGKRRDDSI